VTQVSIPVAGNGTDSKSNAALAALRDTMIPATIGAVPGVTADVTGYTAESKDFNDATKSHLPLVFRSSSPPRSYCCSSLSARSSFRSRR
jgi:RND superfamily putative drug exporter